MKTVYFRLAGNKLRLPNDDVFLTSRHRVKVNSSIFHRNDHTTELRLPYNIFKENFIYDRSKGIYRNNLKWRDLYKYITVIDHVNGKEL